MREHRTIKTAGIAITFALNMLRLRMKAAGLFSALVLLAGVPSIVAGTEGPNTVPSEPEKLPAGMEVALESAYLLGIFNPPRSYEINANFLTARLRWGTNLGATGMWRGYNQLYLSAVAEPIIRGIENHYFGINLGARYNFVQPHSRFVPYISGGLGLGWIDSQPEQFGGQGQDFTFNILMATGISCRLSERFTGEIGLLYQHLSNGGQTDPNPSLNLIGPQIGFTFSF